MTARCECGVVLLEAARRSGHRHHSTAAQHEDRRWPSRGGCGRLKSVARGDNGF